MTETTTPQPLTDWHARATSELVTAIREGATPHTDAEEYDQDDPTGQNETAYYRGLVSGVLRICRTMTKYQIAPVAGRAVPAPSFPALCYINAYAVDQAYGGPEEGGWYYDAGEALASVPVTSYAEAQHARARLRKMFQDKYADNPPREHTNGGPNLEIYQEETVARDFPQTRPHYE